jgi:hypothetical protein
MIMVGPSRENYIFLIDIIHILILIDEEGGIINYYLT